MAGDRRKVDQVLFQAGSVQSEAEDMTGSQLGTELISLPSKVTNKQSRHPMTGRPQLLPHLLRVTCSPILFSPAPTSRRVETIFHHPVSPILRFVVLDRPRPVSPSVKSRDQGKCV